MSIRSDVLSLEMDARIELYRIDTPTVAGVPAQTLYYHDGLNGKLGPIVWKGQTYSPFPIDASGFETNASGKLPRPNITLANIGGAMTDLIAPYGDFTGAKMTRIVTLAKYLDAVNFDARRNILNYTESVFAGSWSILNATGYDIPMAAGMGIQTYANIDVAAGGYINQSHLRTVPAGQYMTISCLARTQTPFLGFGSSTPGGAYVAAVGPNYTVKEVQDGWYRHSYTRLYASAATGTFQFIIRGPIATQATAFSMEIGPLSSYQAVLGAFWVQNPTEDQTQEFPREVWYFDKKLNEDDVFLSYEMCSAFDLPFTMLPARQVLPMCGYLYRDSECGYTGPPVADQNDNATTDPAKDRCGLKVRSCKLRFGATAELPFGGEPVVGLTRL